MWMACSLLIFLARDLTGYCVSNNMDANCKHSSSPTFHAIFKTMSVEKDASTPPPYKLLFGCFIHIFQNQFFFPVTSTYCIKYCKVYQKVNSNG